MGDKDVPLRCSDSSPRSLRPCQLRKHVINIGCHIERLQFNTDQKFKVSAQTLQTSHIGL